MYMGGLMWETITTVGTLMNRVQYGATLQTLARDGTTVLYRSVLSFSEMLDARRRTYG